MQPTNEAPSGRPGESWTVVVEEALARHGGERGALLPVLHDIQDRTGWVPPEAHPRLADALGLSQAEVHGVVTFYHDFRSRPPGRHVLKLCRAEACQAMGSESLADTLKSLAGADFGNTSPDGAVTIENVYCLGNCACSPSLMLDGRLEGRVTAGRLDEIVSDARAGK